MGIGVKLGFHPSFYARRSVALLVTVRYKEEFGVSKLINQKPKPKC